jgi:hypothetical protein
MCVLISRPDRPGVLWVVWVGFCRLLCSWCFAFLSPPSAEASGGFL